MKKKYLNSSVKKYLDDLSAGIPAPGGGSASALVSAVGVSCLLMVVNFTIGKKGYEAHTDELKEILAKLSVLNAQLSADIDEDIVAYLELSGAYKLPKDDKSRNEKIHQALKNALSVPVRILEISNQAKPFAARLSEIGNKNLLSDVDCGISFLQAAIESAKANIDVNLKAIEKAGCRGGK